MSSTEILVFDVGSTFTKASLFGLKRSELVWLGRAQAPTTIEDIDLGLTNAATALAKKIDHDSLQPDYVPLYFFYSTGSYPPASEGPD